MKLLNRVEETHYLVSGIFFKKKIQIKMCIQNLHGLQGVFYCFPFQTYVYSSLRQLAPLRFPHLLCAYVYVYVLLVHLDLTWIDNVF